MAVYMIPYDLHDGKAGQPIVVLGGQGLTAIPQM
jgi:hypothetical protein